MPTLPTLPFGFLFASPLAQALTTLGVAAGAVAIPIIIHLLNRRRYRVVDWAAMRFLLAAQRKNAKRLRLEQWLLLATRVLLVLLLVLAMASVLDWAENAWAAVLPDGGRGGRAGGAPVHKVLVLDGSFSMAARHGDQSCFERARAAARQMVSDAPRGDGFSVVLMAQPPRAVVAEPSFNAAKVDDALQKLRLPHGQADLAATLDLVDELVRKSPARTFDRVEVCFLTDLQQATWLPAHAERLRPAFEKLRGRARTAVLDVGRDGVSNLAVTRLALARPPATTLGDTTLVAAVHNYGAETRQEVRAELWVGKARAAKDDPAFELRLAQERAVTVPGRGEAAVTFRHAFSTPGDYAVQVRLEADDLGPDDRRSAVVTVKDRIPVLLVNGKPAARVLDRATETLATTLDPDETGRLLVKPKVLGVEDFRKANLGNLAPYDCVFFCDVPQFNDEEARRIERYVRNGGGVAFCLGDSVDAASYNRQLFRQGRGLLPAELKDKAAVPEDRPFHLFFGSEAPDDRDERLPPLHKFKGDDRLTLLAAEFHKYVVTKSAGLDRPRNEPALSYPPRKVLSFTPGGDAALWEWQPPVYRDGDAAGRPARCLAAARGRVALLTTTANADWSSWPGSPSYPPFVHELTRYLAGGRLQEQALVVGEPLEEFLPAAGGGVGFTVHTPDGREPAPRGETREHDVASLLRWHEEDGAGTAVSGLYRVALGEYADRLFAVNVPTGDDTHGPESDPARTGEDGLRQAYPNWPVRVFTDPRKVTFEAGDEAGGPQAAADPPRRGADVARWLLLAALALAGAEVVLARWFGHYRRTAGGHEAPPAGGRLFPGLVGGAAAVALLAVAFVLVHEAFTGDFLSFLPDGFRRGVEGLLGVPPAPPGQEMKWPLKYAPFLWDEAADPWLAGLLAVLGVALVLTVYLFEGPTAGVAYKLLLAGVRVGVLLLLLVVLLPQVRLLFQPESLPDVVVLLDDSYSMSTSDAYKDPAVKQAADNLAEAAGKQVEEVTKELDDLKKAEDGRALTGEEKKKKAALEQRLDGLKRLRGKERLALAQALVAGPRPDWLEQLVRQKKFKLHVYHCSTGVERLADAVGPDDVPAAAAAAGALRPERQNDASRLGDAVKRVLRDFKGEDLAAVIMLTDGATTSGAGLAKAAEEARDQDVALFFVGLGDHQPVKDLELYGLWAADSAYVNDAVNFSVWLAGKGFEGKSVPVRLREKGSDKVLAEKTVAVGKGRSAVEVRLQHRPDKPGAKVYVAEVPVQEGEERADNNRVERRVVVQDAEPVKVLYAEGYGRWEYRYVKTLLERESAKVKGNKAVELKVWLQEADRDFASIDASVVPEFPSRADLAKYKLVVLGDVDPRAGPKMAEHLKDLAEFVRQGGGLLVVAGPRFAPHAYRDTPLQDVLPIDLTAERQPPEPEGGRVTGFRPELTPRGKRHPLFQFGDNPEESAKIFARLPEMYWFAEGYRAKPLARVLAVHPTKNVPGNRGKPEPLPLVVEHYAGNGPCLFLGFNETWSWRYREDEKHFNRFWKDAVRYLALRTPDRIDLRLDRPKYHRGDPIEVTVSFPDNAKLPEAAKVEVFIKRVPLPGAGDDDAPGRRDAAQEWRVMLSPDPDAPGTFKYTHADTPEGDYQFGLTEPVLPEPKPRAACRVLAPPGEMDYRQMNKAEMTAAADTSGGGFFTLADADELLDKLPRGTRLPQKPKGEALLWNHLGVLGLVLALLTGEWLLRKRKHLL